MIDPYKKNRSERIQSHIRSAPKTASQKAQAKTKAFLRKTQFKLYKQQGLSDDEAARRVGIKIPFGRRVNIIDIMKKIEEGQEG